MPAKVKVFGIGFQRTGTSSLVHALEILGIKSIHNPVPLLEDLDHPLLHTFDGFADNPLPLIYRDLDRRYPGSKFILTDRSIDEWIPSVRWLFTVAPRLGDWGRGHQAQAMHRALYGGTDFDETVFRARYASHRAEVIEYFAKRPGDLLVIDFTRGEGWEALCPFLDRPVPDRPFPHENPKVALYSPTAITWKLRHLLRRIAMRIRRG